MIIPSLGSLENHTQDGQWKMSGQKYALSCQILGEPGIFFFFNGKIEFRTSDFNNIKVGHYWYFWRKKRKRKILLDHASVSCNLLLSYL